MISRHQEQSAEGQLAYVEDLLHPLSRQLVFLRQAPIRDVSSKTDDVDLCGSMLITDLFQKIALFQHTTFAGLAEPNLRLPLFIHEIECDAFVQVGDVQNPQMSFAQHNEAKRKDLECDRQEQHSRNNVGGETVLT